MSRAERRAAGRAAARAAARAAELNAGVPTTWRAASPTCRRSPPRPTSCWSLDRTGKPVAEVAATYFAAGAFFQLDRIVGAARGIQVRDYFDRLALDRALDSIGEAERRLTAEMVGERRDRRRGGRAWVGRAPARSSASAPRSHEHRGLRPHAVEARSR